MPFKWNPGCICCCPIAWEFTDRGFIDGGQDGALRSYTNPADVAASPWMILNTCLGLRIDFEDSGDNYNRNTGFDPVGTGSPNPDTPGDGCSDHNPYRQLATAEGEVTLATDKVMTVTWSGLGEQEETTFELMSLRVDGDLVGSAEAPGGDLGCAAMGAVVSNPAPPQEVLLTAGTHTIEITADTADNWYHVGAYYQFELSFADPP